MPHESDGLIFTPVEPPYQPGACAELLKWKPAHLNSIDFTVSLVSPPDAPPVFTLSVGDRGQLETWPEPLVWESDTERDMLVQHSGKIIECTLDRRLQGWRFMRVRTDKSYPNAKNTAVRVQQSIRDCIGEEELLQFIASIPAAE